jgi:hypothetical protein
MAIINFLVAETFERLFGVLALLEVLDQSIPEMEYRAQQALQELAEHEGWEYGEYEAERDVLDSKFRHWVPRLAAYSVIALLQAVVETALLRVAEYAGKARGSSFRVKDLGGKGVEQAAVYLQRLISLDVKADPAWNQLRDLQDLRNMIVHRGGKPGESLEHQKVMDRLLAAHPESLILPSDKRVVYGEIWISTRLCKEFAKDIEGFLKRLFRAVGLPDMGVPEVS